MSTPAPSPLPRPTRGRPRKARLDPQQLRVLGIPEAIQLCKLHGRPIGRKKLTLAIAVGALPAFEDSLCRDRMGRPLLKILREDLEAWLASTLRPISTTY